MNLNKRSAQLDDFFREAPPNVDVEAIRRRWLALAPPYDVEHWLLPLPEWAKRPYDYSGRQAWDHLRHELANAGPDKPFCIYLHIPFCSSKCHFCDCYSFKLGSHVRRTIQQYVDRLCYELRLWSRQGNLAERPVSTVHLGGGTPTFLGEAALAQIVHCCRSYFAINEKTEWALESTVESLTPSMMAAMHRLGYRRLHVGVQSLHEGVRAIIKRRRPAAEVLEKINIALDLGWVVSVDLICGLPSQTMASLLADIETLVAIGVNGFSLYELLIYPQNRRWAAEQGLIGRSHIANYFMFQAGASVLDGYGYGKNLFNHWANEHDDNVYFTFPIRGEDCLAVGTIADGVFGEIHYRHPRYAAYMRRAGDGLPGLEGGLCRTACESEMRPIISAILSNTLKAETLPALQRPTGDGRTILERWREMALLEQDRDESWSLTSSGAWFAGNMIQELTGQYLQQPHQA